MHVRSKREGAEMAGERVHAHGGTPGRLSAGREGDPDEHGCMDRPARQSLLISTERLGWPGKESGYLERLGFSQQRRVYPTNPETPTAACHLQPAPDQNALCGYPWEMLVAVPGAISFDDVPRWTRCENCAGTAGAGMHVGGQG